MEKEDSLALVTCDEVVGDKVNGDAGEVRCKEGHRMKQGGGVLWS